MKTFARIGLPALAIAAGAVIAFAPQVFAQGGAAAPVDPAMHATATDPAGAAPDPTHIPIVLPPNIKWTGNVGRSQSATLYGEPNTPGSPYGVLMKWYPGNFSRPHFHTAPRWIYVVSGTWWVSSSSVYNEKLTYPVPAGSFVQDMVNTVHWDGSRAGDKEPAVLLITGIGPAANTAVDENGKAVPRAPGGAATTSPYGAAPAPGR
jgi:quercetin dioxygenase-like cupin family protein